MCFTSAELHWVSAGWWRRWCLRMCSHSTTLNPPFPNPLLFPCPFISILYSYYLHTPPLRFKTPSQSLSLSLAGKRSSDLRPTSPSDYSLYEKEESNYEKSVCVWDSHRHSRPTLSPSLSLSLSLTLLLSKIILYFFHIKNKKVKTPNIYIYIFKWSELRECHGFCLFVTI